MTEEKPRIEWPPEWALEELFGWITRNALAGADAYPPRIGWILRRLEDSLSVPLNPGSGKGATYKQLALVGHRAGLDGQERVQWYEVAEGLGLTQQHVGHIIARLPDHRGAESPSTVSVPS